MKLITLLFIATFFFFCTQAQNRRLTYSSNAGQLRIKESRIDADGNMIHVGDLAMFKTDKTGKVLWSLSSIRSHVTVAANGDYIAITGGISDEGGYMDVIRTDKNGNVLWCNRFYFSVLIDDTITGIIELSNGNIAICGSNNFYDLQSKTAGYLMIIDSTGSIFNTIGRAYGHDWNGVFDKLHVYGIATQGDKIYMVGMYNPYLSSAEQGMIIITDLNGNLLTAKFLDTTIIANNQSLSFISFKDVAIVHDKIFINGWANADAGSDILGVQIIASIDTTTWTMKGQCIYSGSYNNFGAPAFLVKDANEIYSIGAPQQPGTSASTSYFSRIDSGTLTYSKRINQEPAFSVNNINIVNDTIVLTGSYIDTTPGPYYGYCGYFGTFNFSSSGTTLACGVTDTIMLLSDFTGTFTDPVSYPEVIPEGVQGFQFPFNGPICIHESYLCGDTVCNADLKAHLDTLTNTVLCSGDTAQIFSSDCYNKIWLRNDTVLTSAGDTLSAWQPGIYKIIISTGDCADTSATITIKVLPLPVPVIHDINDTLISTPAAAYQWELNGNDIPGATQEDYIILQVTGIYKVRVMDSSGCWGESAGYDYSTFAVSSISGLTNDIHIYPNPVLTTFTISNTGNKVLALGISDITGKQLNKLYAPRGTNQYNIGDLNLSAGLYLVSWQQEGMSQVQKLVILGSR